MYASREGSGKSEWTCQLVWAFAARQYQNLCAVPFDHFFNPFMLNVFSHLYQLDKPISNVRVVGWYFSFLFKF